MDHLPTPIDGERPVVHFYAHHRNYSPKDFYRIPHEYEYDDFEDLLENGLREGMDPSDASQFLQSWLFFGLLSIFLGKDINCEDFAGNSGENLSTKKLRQHLQTWAGQLETSKDEDYLYKHNMQYIQASMALESTRKFVWKHLSFKLMGKDDFPQVEDESKLINPTLTLSSNSVHEGLDPLLTLSIASLGELLQEELWKHLLHLHKEHPKLFRNSSVEGERLWGASKWCRQQMQSRKWCPRDIRRLETTMQSVNRIYYTCVMEVSRPGLNHAVCTMWKCNANRKESVTFLDAKHFHRDSKRNCEMKAKQLPEIQVINIINEGKTPFVKWTDHGQLELIPIDLEDDKSLPPSGYGALSHSWNDSIIHCGTDARGGNNRTILPCQLDKLRDTFASVLGLSNEEPVFWVDVLKAKAVLVWDRNILERPLRSDKRYIELNMRIRYGEWSTRLWTLPEAVLAKNLYVAFKDDYLSTEQIAEARDKARDDPNDRHHFIWRAGHPFSPAIWHLRQWHLSKRDHRQENAFPVQRSWQEIQFRYCSKESDETIVLSAILGLDNSKLLDIGPHQHRADEIGSRRMKSFLDSLDSTVGLGIPPGMIFLPRPRPRTLEPQAITGYTWSPDTWMTQQLHSFPLYRTPNQNSCLMQSGIHVNLDGILLQCLRSEVPNQRFWLTIHQSMHKWFKVHAAIAEEDWIEFWTSEVCEYHEPSIILNVQSIRERWELGLLVSSQGRLASGQVRRVKTLCRVWIRLESNTNIIKKLKKEFREKPEGKMIGLKVRDQQWCVE
ncbi:putative Heterokaryon incompatibility domain-containing protein [Seiridium cardinale]